MALAPGRTRLPRGGNRFFFAEWLSMVEWEFDASTKNGLNVLQLPGAKSSGSRRRRKR